MGTTEVVSAIAATCSALAAAFAAFQSKRSADVARQTTVRAARSQASQVSAWPSQMELGGGQPATACITVSNQSNEPVHNLCVAVWSSYPHGEAGAPQSFHILPPGTTRSVPLKHKGSDGNDLADDHADHLMSGRICLTFRDANQQRWARYPDGSLREVDPGVRIPPAWNTPG